METVVVLPRAAPPPALCFRCGAGAGLALVPCKLRTTPKDSAALDAAQAAGFVIGWLGPVADLVEVARVAHGTREATVGIPLCVSCAAAWRKAKAAEAAVAIDDAAVALSRVHPSAGAAVAAAARAQSTPSAPPSRPPSTPSSFL